MSHIQDFVSESETKIPNPFNAPLAASSSYLIYFMIVCFLSPESGGQHCIDGPPAWETGGNHQEPGRLLHEYYQQTD